METKIFLYKGDNKEVINNKLKSKPNIVYIDPPYNTWNKDLLYHDKRGSDEWIKCFKNLLISLKGKTQDNCVFFISIDNNELANVILASKEIIGKKSIISIVPRRTHSGNKSSKTIINLHDYIVVIKKGQVDFNGIDLNSKNYNKVDRYLSERGKYMQRKLDQENVRYSRNLDYKLEINGKEYYPGGVTRDEFEKRRNSNPARGFCWLWKRELVEFAIQNDYISVDKGKIYKKIYTKSKISKTSGYKIVNEEKNRKIDSLHFTKEVFAVKKNKSELEKLFNYSKSDELIWELLKLPNFEEKIVLDPFGGTGTTAIIADELNFKEAHIIQKSEKTEKNSLAYTKGYLDIYDITKDNIKLRTESKNIIEFN